MNLGFMAFSWAGRFTKRSRNRRETDRAEITYGSRKSHENMPQHASWVLICLHAHEINALGVMCVLS